MDIKTKYGWQELYATALLETDWLKMEGRIHAAENGIRARLHEFSVNHGGTPEENQAIEDALNGFKILRKEVATWQQSKQAGSLKDVNPVCSVPCTGRGGAGFFRRTAAFLLALPR
jgi:hypothetical protein